ncbi:MAG: hypothetical protein UEU47_08605 [Oscillospiraceae bacterium]|nr:hypothetical protein [Oscillospiraceae bacterium]
MDKIAIHGNTDRPHAAKAAWGQFLGRRWLGKQVNGWAPRRRIKPLPGEENAERITLVV